LGSLLDLVESLPKRVEAVIDARLGQLYIKPSGSGMGMCMERQTSQKFGQNSIYFIFFWILLLVIL